MINLSGFPELFDAALWKKADENTVQRVASLILDYLGSEYKLYEVTMPATPEDYPKVIFEHKIICKFFLIPGGELTPGLSEAEYQKLSQLHKKAKAHEDQIEEMENNGILVTEEHMPKEWLPDAYFLGWFLSGADKIRNRPTERIAPFLLGRGTWPLTRLKPYVELIPGTRRMHQYDKQTLNENCALYFSGPEIKKMGSGFGGWELPSASMWEYAYRGGKKDMLFYWGDEYTEIPELPPHPFGILEMGLEMEVCADDWHEYNQTAYSAENPEGRMIKGGAGLTWPWQGCGEWMALLCAARTRMSLDGLTQHKDFYFVQGAAVRPVIKLV